jgi:hypothetical protein
MADGAVLSAARGRWAKSFAATTLVGVFLGLVGPFGSFFNGPVWQRVVYWVLNAWISAAFCAPGIRLILSRFASERARWTGLAVLAAIAPVPITFVGWPLAHAMWPVLRRLSWLTPAVWYAESLVIAAPLVLLFGWAAMRSEVRHGAERRPGPGPGLLGAAPSEVLCLQMEDHYVRVHTAGGSRLVLATMAQAVEGLGRAPGLRVHRSWWVADKAVAAAVSEGRNLRLVLLNGLSAPVARSSVAAVREAGWLERGRVAQAL